jgi:hypothetical protein
VRGGERGGSLSKVSELERCAKFHLLEVIGSGGEGNAAYLFLLHSGFARRTKHIIVPTCSPAQSGSPLPLV